MQTSSYVPHPDVLATELDDGEIVLLHATRGRYYSLNESAGLLWRSLPTASTAPALAAALCAVYEVSPASAEAAAEAWLTAMGTSGLICRDPNL